MRSQNKTKLTPLSYDEIYQFCEQLSLLFASGITPIEGLEIMLRDKDNANINRVIDLMYQDVLEGATLSDAVQKIGVFPVYVQKLISIGEQTGHLDIVTGRLAEYYEEAALSRRAMRDALAYPILMIVLMFAVILVLLQNILPIFEQIFSQLGTASSDSFAFLMNISHYLSSFYVVLIIIFAAFILLFLYFYYSPKGQQRLRSFMENFPLTKNFVRLQAIGRFAEGMEMTQAAGLDTFVGIDLCRDIVDNKEINEKLDKAEDLIRSGETFSDAMISVGIFSPFYAGMLHAAAASGSTDRVMGYISRHYKQDAHDRLSRIIGAVEPTMVIFLSIIIGMILLSLILPLLGIMSNIG